jgi:general secretion pathway protein L
MEEALAAPAGDGKSGADRGFVWDETGTADPALQRLAAGPVSSWQSLRLGDVPPETGAARLEGMARGASCLGLVLDQGDAPPAGVDLLPKPAAAPRGRAGGRVTAALAVLLLGMAALHGATLYRDRQGRLKDLRGEIGRLKSRVETIKTMADDLKKREGRLAAARGGGEGRVLTVELLRELTEAIPANAYLSQVTLKRNTLELTGFADAASELIPRLEASPRFKNVAFDAPITSQGQQKERFKIKLALE